jgi:hypothetical protein
MQASLPCIAAYKLEEREAIQVQASLTCIASLASNFYRLSLFLYRLSLFSSQHCAVPSRTLARRRCRGGKGFKAL